MARPISRLIKPDDQTARQTIGRWLRSNLHIVLAVLSLLLVSCGGARNRMVLLIVVDTMRADHLGCYGYGAIDTPHIDRLAHEGILYETAISAVPVTLPSVATILTGAYPLQHGLRDNGPYQLSDQWLTLAECLQQAGYSTGAFVSAAVLSRDHNLVQGFDVYDDDMAAPYVPHHPLMIPIKDQFQGTERRAELTVDRAMAWARNRGNQNIFLMVHLFDPHVPRDPPPPFPELYSQRLYDGEIAYVDREIGRLLAELRRTRRGSDILTIVVADHGEGLGDHEEELHGDLLFEETMRVPLILHGPGITPGARVEELVRTVDIVPTICAATGIKPPDWSIGTPLPRSHSKDEAGLSQSRQPVGRTAYLETFRPRLANNWCELRGLRTQHWKLIEGPGYELYDLSGDGKESDNVAEKHQGVRDSLIQVMDRVALRSFRRGSHFAESLDLSQEKVKKLESLGYITPTRARPPAGDSLAIWYFPPAQRGRALGLPNPRVQVAATYQRMMAESLCGSARAALRKGDLQEAARLYQQAIRHKETLAVAHLGLAEVARRAGRMDTAVSTLEAAQNVLPEDPAIAGALTDALVTVGRFDEALRVVEHAINTGFADSVLYEKRAGLRERSKAPASRAVD
ncbi:MAG: sulfatase-like hydrolase/transferase [Candidatus Krumholzibacteria bacterium]|nr:sulfatase-like hydrolase/transferase [Candidatus Krumholzibacteria bacterium]